MNQESNHERDEQRLAALLSLAAQDAPSPDQTFLERLREQSFAVFAAQSVPASLPQLIPEAEPQPSLPTAQVLPERSTRRSPMFFFAWRIAAATATAAALVVACFSSLFTGGEADAAFGKVLDRRAAAKSL